jgi:uncharacterized protein YneF (UPF0154 family)
MIFFRTYRNQLLFTLIGIVIGFFIERITHIKFVSEINPVDFANLFLTLIIALVIGLFIEPSNEKSRVEKELHIEQLKAVKEVGKEINNFFINCYNEDPLVVGNKDKMVGLFRSLSNQVELFLSQANYSKAKYIINQKTEITSQLFKFKKALTGGQYTSSTFSYKTGGFNKYEAQYLNFSKRVNQLIIDINKK